MNKKVVEFFEQDFVLTGDSADPRDIDFSFYTQKLTTRNPDGLILQKLYYLDYDMQGGQFTDLAVEVRYNYTFNPDATVARLVKDIRWYFTDGSIGATRLIAEVFQ